MEIIHIILGKANPERLNGVNKVVYNLARKQAEIGEKVSVWGITENLERNFAERNFETQLFKKNKNPFTIPRGLKKEILKKDKKTVFHIHGGWIPVYYSLSNFFKKHKMEFVITSHGAYNAIAMKKNFLLKKLYFLFFEKKILINSKKIHCIGKSETDGINKIYPIKKHVLIPYGFDVENKTVTAYNKNSIITFGFIGRIDINTKGLDILISAFEEFQQRISNSRLWIIGSGKEISQLKEIISKKNLNDKIELFGSKFGTEKETLIKQMDVFMHPSRNEGLPVSVIEAASYSKPCIVSSFTNIGDEIKKYNAGINVTHYSYIEFAKAMLELYKAWQNGDTIISIGNNAKKMVEQEYDWDIILNKLKVNLYEYP